jgi:hypothetical protein
MEQSYWLERMRASGANARGAESSRARLIHFDLAGRYSVMAARAAAARSTGEGAGRELRLSLEPPEMPDAAHYERLEIGARWLASRAATEAERHEHLATANRYARQRLEAAASGRL